MNGSHIRRLVVSDCDAYVALRREAVANEPYSYPVTPAEDESADPAVFVRRVGEVERAAFLGAFGPELVGVAGVYRDALAKCAHKANIWGLYVAPAYRSAGLGRALTLAAIVAARGIDGVTQVHLRVMAAVPHALELYQDLGFETWGTEPAAIRVDNRSLDQHHMVLPL